MLKYRFIGLNLYQKVLIIFMAAMILVFTVLFALTVSREGYSYRNAILVPQEDSGDTVYVGRLKGKETKLTVTSDKTVTLDWGGTIYGPYILREDESAIPAEMHRSYITGLEIRCGEEVLFRGCYEFYNPEWVYIYDEEENLVSADTPISRTGTVGLTYTAGPTYAVDKVEPAVGELIELTEGPALTHKGYWLGWLAGILFCVCNTIWILYADELFTFSMSVRIKNAASAQPTGWEIWKRCVGWTVLCLDALACFIGCLI